MPTVVPQTPPLVHLLSSRVANPVNFGTGLSIVDAINFLLGRNKHVVCSQSRLPKANCVQNFRYYRSPGAMLLLVCVVPWNGTASSATLTINAAISGASVVGYTRLDGSATIQCGSNNVRAPAQEYKVLDISGLTVGTASELTITAVDGGAGTSQGVEHVSAVEIFRDMLDSGASPSTEPGINQIFPVAGNDIYAGTASTAADIGGGTERVIGQLQSVKADVQNFVLNIAFAEDTTNALSTTSGTFAAFTGLTSARFYCLPRRWYTTATALTVNVRLRYLSAGGDMTVRLITTPVGGSPTNNDITCTTSGTWATATGTATIDTSGTDGVAYIEIQAKVAAGTGYLGASSMI